MKTKMLTMGRRCVCVCGGGGGDSYKYCNVLPLIESLKERSQTG